jgi:hypothetical protein
MTTARLGDIATARGGDKGDTCNICVFVTKETDYQAVRAQLTAERVAAAYPRLFRGPVKRYAVDHLMVLNFVIANGLEGGVNASLNLDTHGKSARRWLCRKQFTIICGGDRRCVYGQSLRTGSRSSASKSRTRSRRARKS